MSLSPNAARRYFWSERGAKGKGPWPKIPPLRLGAVSLNIWLKVERHPAEKRGQPAQAQRMQSGLAKYGAFGLFSASCQREQVGWLGPRVARAYVEPVNCARPEADCVSALA